MNHGASVVLMLIGRGSRETGRKMTAGRSTEAVFKWSMVLETSLIFVFFTFDQELFNKVVVHHCLGCIWSQRHKKKNQHLASTIRAMVIQFNIITKCMISTILKDVKLKPDKKARVIEKWITIAVKSRIMKNFSSLRAIVAALQSSPIYKLKTTWAAVSNSMGLFEELEEQCCHRIDYHLGEEPYSAYFVKLPASTPNHCFNSFSPTLELLNFLTASTSLQLENLLKSHLCNQVFSHLS
ncbi:ral guanine nucleotide dissociation stimulator-like 1 [Heterodontus francisci]|uniref:ral guanine nucleotide dissociation stimulator-like 1 n=1 Tax=Heterodontus francisci TaxID=7792 RepID=UPI00355B8697